MAQDGPRYLRVIPAGSRGLAKKYKQIHDPFLGEDADLLQDSSEYNNKQVCEK